MADLVGIAARRRVVRALPPTHPSNRSAGSRAAAITAWRAFDSRTVARARRREHVLCLGDSHLRALAGVSVRQAWFQAFAVGGATASGIESRSSASGARQLFERRLALAPRWQHVLCALGEVDCGFLIWRRASEHDLRIDEQLAATLDSYARFLAAVAEMGFASVGALTATLPTLPDYRHAQRNETARERVAVTASLRERTQLTLEYNAALGERCRQLGLHLVDTTPAQLDPSTGLVRAEMAADGDHHLHRSAYTALLNEALAAPELPWRRRAGLSGTPPRR